MPTVGAIAEQLGFEAEGDLALEISSVSHPSVAGRGDLALAMDKKHARRLGEGAAQAALLAPGEDWRALGLSAAIFAPRARNRWIAASASGNGSLWSARCCA